MTKMLSASLDPLGALPPVPRYRLVLRTRHGAPQPLTPSAAYGPPLEKNPVGAPDCYNGNNKPHIMLRVAMRSNYYNLQ